jgi:hypothetical protein
MKSPVDRICAQIKRHLRAVSRNDAKPETVETTKEKPRFPAGLGEARMRFELERYFTIDVTAYGFDDSDADDIPTEAVQYNVDFEFADPESLKVRPENLSPDEVNRWDMWEMADGVVQAPSPAEIDYCTLLARLDRINGNQLRQSDDDNSNPGLFEQFLRLAQ